MTGGLWRLFGGVELNVDFCYVGAVFVPGVEGLGGFVEGDGLGDDFFGGDVSGAEGGDDVFEVLACGVSGAPDVEFFFDEECGVVGDVCF